ncbi:uncharacterized protein LOC111610000 isoform X2 [Xiphophorus maculatus]|uniref:uncharacterized protein LOC111610000 isoform X2 n=1 Tax=Xiphophorus maculatus TaxID=8083 RepID=UPI000C6D570F|nr:uncharacterized protein LOC111610000 isoform X2 [Xiphophorus maculatus]
MRSRSSDRSDGGVESTPSCSSLKATDETFGLDPEQRQMDQTRQARRLQKLKAHHNKCEAHHKKLVTKLPLLCCIKATNEVRENTSFLHQKGLMSKQSSDESDDTIILGPTPTEGDMSVPELTRTDSVILNKQMLCYSEASLSSSDITEEEYVPNSEESESDSLNDSDSSVDVKQLKKRKKRAQKNTSSLEVQPLKRMRVTTSSSLTAKDPGESSSTDAKYPGESSSTDAKDPGESSSLDVTVMTLKKKGDGSRAYNKRYFCAFCSKPYSKMARHLEAKHSDIPEVESALKCPKGSRERRLQLSLIRNKGNRAHNNKVIKEGKGMLIPRQQCTKSAKAGDYLHCINCEGYLKRKSLWRHMQRCYLSQKVKGLKPGTSRVQAICKYAEPVPDSVNAQFWKLIRDMHHDDVAKVVQSEKCILKFGEHLFNKHGQDVTRHEYIRQKMRETARVVLQGKKDGKLETLPDFFVPANFPHVIDAVKKVAGLDERTNVFKTPSLALKLGHNLKKVANVLECEAMISGDENTIHNVQIFKQICETRWSECVSSHALRTLNEAKWNAPQLIPFAEDVRKMHQYLDTKRMECQRNLKEEAVKKNWAELAKITLCEVIIFNRRREGEVSKMPLNAFTLRDTSVTHPDVELALSELEKKLCKHFQRIEIKGKRGRKVPILLTPNMASSMELLVQNRHNCDVLDENPYMFGRPQTLNHFRGSDIIREMAQNCGAKHPGALSSTKLRKHMATMSKVLNLKDNEMDDLADFLGHDIRVHRQYYRLPEGTLQLAKISKVLLALERGQLSHFKGRNLDEISIDPQEKMSVDSGSDTEEEVDSAERDDDTSSSRSPDVDGNKKVENGQFGVTRRCTTEVGQSNDLPSAKERSDDEVLADMEISGNSNTTNGPPQKKRLKWNQEEIQAVEKTLMDCIDSGKVPGKAQCMKCIETSPVALKDRTWQGIKFYVKNRIDALKRETFKRR